MGSGLATEPYCCPKPEPGLNPSPNPSPNPGQVEGCHAATLRTLPLRSAALVVFNLVP